MMTGNRINKFIVVMVLLALVGSLMAGAMVVADENALDVHSCAMCASGIDCPCSKSPSACTNTTASSGCGCTISSAPDTRETPMVVPVTSRQLGIDSLIAALPVQFELEEHPRLTWTVTSEQIIYDFLYFSSSDGRSPPV